MRRPAATIATAVAVLLSTIAITPAAQADVSRTLVGVRTGYTATTQQSFSLPSGPQVVTAVMALTPRDPASQDFRCRMQAISATNVTTLLDETVIRVQDTIPPLPTVSNSFPTITLLGVVSGPAVLRVACTRVAGSGTAPRVDRLKVVADNVAGATASDVFGQNLSSVIRNRTTGQVRALATVSLEPQDTTAGDLTCSLTILIGGTEVPAVLDSTVVRVRQTPAGQGGTSNALPQVTLAGFGDAGDGGEVKVFCAPGQGKQFVQPQVRRAVLVVHPANARTETATERPVVDGNGRGQIWVEGSDAHTVVATVTMRPVSEAAGDLVCKLVLRRERVSDSVEDEVRVRVKAIYDPNPLTSNAFPRITLVAAANSANRPADYGVRCESVAIPGYQQPIVERVTLTVARTGSVDDLQ